MVCGAGISQSVVQPVWCHRHHPAWGSSLGGACTQKVLHISHFIHIILSPFGHETRTKGVRAAMAHQLSIPLICTLLPILYFLARSVPSAGVHKKVIGWSTAESHAEISVTLFLFDVSNTPRHPGVATGLS